MAAESRRRRGSRITTTNPSTTLRLRRQAGDDIVGVPAGDGFPRAENQRDTTEAPCPVWVSPATTSSATARICVAVVEDVAAVVTVENDPDEQRRPGSDRRSGRTTGRWAHKGSRLSNCRDSAGQMPTDTGMQTGSSPHLPSREP